MRFGKLRLGAVSLLGAVLVLTGCAAPPEKLNGQAEALPGQISDVRGQLDKATKDFTAKLKSDKYEFMNSYSREQQHHNLYGDAKKKLDEADQIVNNTVNPLLDDYDEARQKELQDAVNKVIGLKDDAKQLVPLPVQWLDKVVATKSNPDKVVTAAKTTTDSLVTDHTALKGVADNAKTTFPKQTGGIDRRFQPLTDLQTSAASAFTTLQAESLKSSPNYALMTEDADLIAGNRATFTKEDPKFRAAVGELPVSETHTLLDIRVESELEIERTSWEESESIEFPDEHSHVYTRRVDLNTANYFAQFGVDTLLATDGGWGGFETEGNVDRKQWDKLKIDSIEKMVGGDNTSEFTFGGLEETICHKLMVMRNGKPDTSARPSEKDNPDCRKYDNESDVARGIYWVEADEFRGDAIGMDIYSKGAGDFADQATEAATPPGMAYVGDPNTGQWQTDSSGNEFWAFYGQYMFFSQLIGGPNSYHYRTEYNAWGQSYRYNDRDYYAGSSSNPRYGAKSPQAASRFPGTNYSKTGLRDATVRNAGPAARAGGPGGGGK